LNPTINNVRYFPSRPVRVEERKRDGGLSWAEADGERGGKERRKGGGWGGGRNSGGSSIQADVAREGAPVISFSMTLGVQFQEKWSGEGEVISLSLCKGQPAANFSLLFFHLLKNKLSGV
jgi:hypothetical protein